MYNKLFSKIVDSSIWLEPTPTRIVWLMFIAVMNEDGFVQFASIANVAHRARVTNEEAEEALRILESPDANSADDDNEGRRIEKVPGGWMVLNAAKYRDLVTREMQRAATRERVARHRRKLKGNADVTKCNVVKRKRNAPVMQSDTDTDTKKDVGANGSRPTADDWLKTLEADQTYTGINVRQEYGKMLNWCTVHGKQATQRRFVNWINRAEKPLNAPKPSKPVYGRNYMSPVREPTDEEIQKARDIAKREADKFRQEQNR